jgi:hypothetical protein
VGGWRAVGEKNGETKKAVARVARADKGRRQAGRGGESRVPHCRVPRPRGPAQPEPKGEPLQPCCREKKRGEFPFYAANAFSQTLVRARVLCELHDLYALRCRGLPALILFRNFRLRGPSGFGLTCLLGIINLGRGSIFNSRPVRRRDADVSLAKRSSISPQFSPKASRASCLREDLKEVRGMMQTPRFA